MLVQLELERRISHPFLRPFKSIKNLDGFQRCVNAVYIISCLKTIKVVNEYLLLEWHGNNSIFCKFINVHPRWLLCGQSVGWHALYLGVVLFRQIHDIQCLMLRGYYYVSFEVIFTLNIRGCFCKYLHQTE